MSEAKAVPEGFHTATPILVVKDAAEAISFYKEAFGATEETRHSDASGKIQHAEVRVGDSVVMIEEGFEFGGVVARSPAALNGTTMFLYLYVIDVDAAVTRAIEAGGRELMPVSDTYYGDRRGCVIDPSGHLWFVATRKEDLSVEEIQRRAAAGPS